MNSMRRPLGHGPASLDNQEVRAVRGRTAAERAVEEPSRQRPAPRTEPGSISARRSLGAGPGA
ncbi:hypothetical protein [Streptomyces sp. NPDC054797]